MGFAVYDEHILQQPYSVLANADGTGIKTFYQAPTPGARVDSLWAVSDDTVDHTVNLVVQANGDNIFLPDVLIPAGAGHGAVPAVELITASVSPLMGCILLFEQFQLAINLPVIVSSGKHLWIWGQGGAF